MNTDKKINILIVEDHALTRFGLKTAFESLDYVSNIYEAEDSESAIEVVEKNKIDIVLMDLGLPDVNGIETTKNIKQINKSIKVVILTSHQSDEEVWASLSAGANAYCLKDIEPDRLIQVVENVADGAAWLDPAVADVVLKGVASTPKYSKSFSSSSNSNISLTDRETEVLKLIVEGRNNADIAKKLYVSIHTAKAHVCSILQKLSVDDRTQAAIKAIKDGIV
ncbi:MAG: response regulator transcription factor [Candidatus Gastranaerophilales bacterium]|nr:response regulator transcription factor [Candidatus Gastranaerophilales bacterium]